MNVEDKRVDLNTADQQTLDDLPGIGPALAARIIEYRETAHPFEEVIELAAVPGVSEKMVRQIEHLLEVNPPAVEEMDFQPGVLLAVETVTADEEGEPDLPQPEPEAAEPEVEIQIITEAETAVAEEAEDDIEADAPQEDASQEDASQADAPQEDASQADAPEADAPEADAPEADAPEADAPEETEDYEEDDAFIVPYAPPPPAPTVVQQGYSLRALMASSLVTAVATILLTLGLLYLLNGTLYFASDARADKIEARGDEALQGSLDIATALGNLTSRVNSLSRRVDGLAGQQQESQQGLTAVESDISALQESTDALDERVSGVAAAAANFDQFLDGLRDLLLNLRGEPTPPDSDAATPDAPTETAVHTMTPEATIDRQATITLMPPSPTPTSTPTLAAPTRTPRPTATPLP